MIKGEWKDPNYKITVEDNNGNQDTWITYGESENALRERLKDLGYIVISLAQYDFQQWLERAKKATEKAEDEFAKKRTIKNFNLNDSLWGELKFHLFELFHGKCAYCESKATIGSWGDVEHYRPKKAVEGVDNHPGYFWLAYSTENFFPSCQKCNQSRGKLTKFPVVDGTRAFKKEDIANEIPLLINPYQEDPREFLSFNIHGAANVRQGTANFDKANESIRVYFLNRPGIEDERRIAMSNIVQELGVKSISDIRELPNKYREIITEVAKGEKPYAAASLDELERTRLKIVRELMGE